MDFSKSGNCWMNCLRDQINGKDEAGAALVAVRVPHGRLLDSAAILTRHLSSLPLPSSLQRRRQPARVGKRDLQVQRGVRRHHHAPLPQTVLVGGAVDEPPVDDVKRSARPHTQKHRIAQPVLRIDDQPAAEAVVRWGCDRSPVQDRDGAREQAEEQGACSCAARASSVD